jgi:hypothetical protein
MSDPKKCPITVGDKNHTPSILLLLVFSSSGNSILEFKELLNIAVPLHYLRIVKYG